jgi:hypothetical protein
MDTIAKICTGIQEILIKYLSFILIYKMSNPDQACGSAFFGAMPFTLWHKIQPYLILAAHRRHYSLALPEGDSSNFVTLNQKW